MNKVITVVILRHYNERQTAAQNKDQAMNDLAKIDRSARQDPEDAEKKIRAMVEAERQGFDAIPACALCGEKLPVTGAESSDPEQQDRCAGCAWEVEEWGLDEFNRGSDGSDGYALVIDPDNRKVWARGHVGGGRSFDEMYRRVLAPAVDKGIAGDQARQVVMARLSQLDEIASLYECSEFRNGNEFGLWSDLARAQELAQMLAERVNGVARLWSAEEWFVDGLPVEQVIGHESVEAYVAAECSGASGDVILDSAEVDEWVRGALSDSLEEAESDLEDIEAELEDEDDEDEREEIEERARDARGRVADIRRLLEA